MRKPQTVGDWIAHGAERMQAAGVSFGQGTTNAEDESRWLVLHAMGLAIDSDDAVLGHVLDAQQAARLTEHFDRRITAREPAAYITQMAWLKGYGFHASPKAIIPRSFIAELLLEQMHPWLTEPRAIRSILDLCTGSASLAIIAADAFAGAQIVAADLSEDALSLARQNLQAYSLSERISLVRSDLFLGIDSAARFDLIISNPPYVPLSRRAEMPEEFQHEPDMALFADDDGMALVRTILKQSASYLNPNGLLVVEVGAQTRACEAMLATEFHQMPVCWVETEEQSANVFVVDKPTLDQYLQGDQT